MKWKIEYICNKYILVLLVSFYTDILHHELHPSMHVCAYFLYNSTHTVYTYLSDIVINITIPSDWDFLCEKERQSVVYSDAVHLDFEEKVDKLTDW